MKNLTSLFPENTGIKDFAYSESNPLRYGHFKVNSHYEEGDEDYDDEDESYLYDDFNDNELNDNDNLNIEINRRAVALFDFKPENDNEVELVEGQIILISYRHGQGWLVAEDPETGENGLVPEEYVELIDDNSELPKPFLPDIFQKPNIGFDDPKHESDSEWVDTEDEENLENNVSNLLSDINNMNLK